MKENRRSGFDLGNGANWLNKQIDSLQRDRKHLFFEVNLRISVPLSLQGKTGVNGNQRKILGIGSLFAEGRGLDCNLFALLEILWVLLFYSLQKFFLCKQE